VQQRKGHMPAHLTGRAVPRNIVTILRVTLGPLTLDKSAPDLDDLSHCDI